MTGDSSDILKRLRLALPTRWFGDIAPVLDGILAGPASAWSSLYTLLCFVVTQSRVATVTDQFIELAAQDFLSDSFARRSNETDSEYRARLLLAIRRERGTRSAIVAAAASAGYMLNIFEPAQPISTGAYNIASGLAWNTIGGWGSMEMPLESLIIAKAGVSSFESELWESMSHAAPAGGALWMRVVAAQ